MLLSLFPNTLHLQAEGFLSFTCSHLETEYRPDFLKEPQEEREEKKSWKISSNVIKKEKKTTNVAQDCKKWPEAAYFPF